MYQALFEVFSIHKLISNLQWTYETGMHVSPILKIEYRCTQKISNLPQVTNSANDCASYLPTAIAPATFLFSILS
jgi:hypothetical protein